VKNSIIDTYHGISHKHSPRYLGELCSRFNRDLYSWEELEKAIRLVTGLDISTDQLREIAAHIVNMTRKYNIQEGLGPKDDRLPKRLTDKALPSGKALSAEEMEYMLNDYYRLRGWDENGLPLTR